LTFYVITELDLQSTIALVIVSLNLFVKMLTVSVNDLTSPNLLNKIQLRINLNDTSKLLSKGDELNQIKDLNCFKNILLEMKDVNKSMVGLQKYFNFPVSCLLLSMQILFINFILKSSGYDEGGSVSQNIFNAIGLIVNATEFALLLDSQSLYETTVSRSHHHH